MTGRTVLLVDDEAGVRDVMTAFLVRAGHGVLIESAFAQAKARIVSSPPDALVVDVRLGPHNGLQLAWLLRSLRPDARIVVMSGFDDATLRQEAQRVDAPFLLKPFPGRVLVESLGPAQATLA